MIKQITRKQLKKEVKKLIALIEPYTNVNKELRDKLEKLGYTWTMVGAGKQSYICSKDIKELNLNNSFIKGDYLAIGTANTGYGKGQRYNAFIKEIV